MVGRAQGFYSGLEMANRRMGGESCGLWQEIKVILGIKGGKGREISPFLRSSLAIRAEKCIVRVAVFFYSFFNYQ